LRVVIALPQHFDFAIGGYHVHYQYANLLAERGHQVTIIFPRYLSAKHSIKGEVGALIWALKTRLENRPLIPSFHLRRDVRIRLVRDLAAGHLPDADILIATAWQTAEVLRGAPPKKGRKFYIVYDYEHYMQANEELQRRILRTYVPEFEIIATSSAVSELLKLAGAHPVANIVCGVDFASFGLDIPPQIRANFTLGFPARYEKYKGASEAIAAAEHLRELYGSRLRVATFGSHQIPMPSWIEWSHRPSQEQLRNFYNSRAVFVVPSHYEGWGLTGVEAMACGAALVTTDNGGSRDYAINENTALVVPAKRGDLLANAVRRLFEDDQLRIRLAYAGHEKVQQYQWNTSASLLERALTAVAPSSGGNQARIVRPAGF
jgi:L-malate glycosyltransferase